MIFTKQYKFWLVNDILNENVSIIVKEPPKYGRNWPPSKVYLKDKKNMPQKKSKKEEKQTIGL